MIVYQRFLARFASISPRTRVTLLVTFVLAVVLVATLVPQVSVWACSGTGSCPCPGC